MQTIFSRIRSWADGRSGKALTISIILCLSLALRGDDGCVTADRDVIGTIILSVVAPWETRGFVESTATDFGDAGDFVNQFIDALDDVPVEEILAAIDAGEPILIAGASARVIRSGGHDAARTGYVRVTPSGGGAVDLLRYSTPTNVAGTEIFAGDTRANYDLTIDAAGVDAVADAIADALRAYEAGDTQGIRDALLGLNFEAQWNSTPPPTEQDPDDFDWETEIVLHVPAQYSLTTPNF